MTEPHSGTSTTDGNLMLNGLFGSEPVGAMFKGGPLLSPDDLFWGDLRQRNTASMARRLEVTQLGFDTDNRFSHKELPVGKKESLLVTSTDTENQYEVIVVERTDERYQVIVRAHREGRPLDATGWAPMTLFCGAGGTMSFASGW